MVAVGNNDWREVRVGLIIIEDAFGYSVTVDVLEATTTAGAASPTITEKRCIANGVISGSSSEKKLCCGRLV